MLRALTRRKVLSVGLNEVLYRLQPFPYKFHASLKMTGDPGRNFTVEFYVNPLLPLHTRLT